MSWEFTEDTGVKSGIPAEAVSVYNIMEAGEFMASPDDHIILVSSPDPVVVNLPSVRDCFPGQTLTVKRSPGSGEVVVICPGRIRYGVQECESAEFIYNEYGVAIHDREGIQGSLPNNELGASPASDGFSGVVGHTNEWDDFQEEMLQRMGEVMAVPPDLLGGHVTSTELQCYTVVFLCSSCGHQENVRLGSFSPGSDTTLQCECGGEAYPC